jgi:hypothetical protein
VVVVLLGFLLSLFPSTLAAQDAESLPVRAQVAPGVNYVGQGIEINVGVVAEMERPEVVPPKVAGADLTLVGTSFRPISASGIGDVVAERNQFLSRYRLVPQRAGTLEIPPFRARLGARSGASRPLRLTIQAPPLAGRPAGFLGGVGPFEVAAEASPANLRAGQEFEFRIHLTGPGALGATRTPSLERFERLPLGLEVEPIASEVVAEPPSRVFRYRLRPTRVGEVVLPPVAVSAFDPNWNQYVTKVTAGVPVRVVAVPRFDPDSFVYGPAPNPLSSRTFGPKTILAMVITLAGLLLAGVAWIWNRRGRSRRINTVRLARRLALSLDLAKGLDEIARATVDGLIAYLALAAGRPAGALTPEEARNGFFQAEGSADLAARAERLVDCCDRIRFGREEASAEPLATESRLFFNELARVRIGKKGGSQEGEQPREAVETAS